MSTRRLHLMLNELNKFCISSEMDRLTMDIVKIWAVMSCPWQRVLVCSPSPCPNISEDRSLAQDFFTPRKWNKYAPQLYSLFPRTFFNTNHHHRQRQKNNKPTNRPPPIPRKENFPHSISCEKQEDFCFFLCVWVKFTWNDFVRLFLF